MVFRLFVMILSIYQSTRVHYQCDNNLVRKEIRSLSKRELNEYIDAVKKLHYKSIDIKFSKIHYQYKKPIHEKLKIIRSFRRNKISSKICIVSDINDLRSHFEKKI